MANAKIRVLGIRDQLQQLSRSLPEPGWHSVNTFQIQFFQLEEQVIDRANQTSNASVPTTAHDGIPVQPVNIFLRISEHLSFPAA